MAQSTEASIQSKYQLPILLQDYYWTDPIKSGEVSSPLFDFVFDGVKEANTRFKPFARELAYPIGELAIVTFLQAKYYGKELVLLPFVVHGSFHHKSIAYNADKGEVTPATLGGKTIGVRTYSQTTGVWVRGILLEDYGANLDSATFITWEDAHLAEHQDPPNCVRATGDKKLGQMLLDGDIAVGLLGGNMPKDPNIKPVIPDPDNAAKAWAAKHGVTPINHMLVATKAICEERPGIVKAACDTLAKARALSQSPFPVGFDGDWTALEMVSRFAHRQGVVGRTYSVDELFADARKVLVG